MPGKSRDRKSGLAPIAMLLLCLSACQSAEDYHNSLLKRGLEHVRGGRLQEGIGVFNNILQRDPQHKAALIARSMAYADLGQYEEALADADKAVPIPIAYRTRGWVYMHLNRCDEAIADAKKLLSTESELANAYAILGGSYSRLKDFENAAANYKRVCELEPDNENALYNYGGMLVELGRYDEAITVFTRAITLKPRDYGGWALRANARSLSGDLKGAEEDQHAAKERREKSENSYHEFKFYVEPGEGGASSLKGPR